MSMFESNGGADIFGTLQQQLQKSAQDTLSGLTSTAVDQSLEQLRQNQGKTKLQFYGGMAVDYAKTHWTWIALIIGGVIVLVWGLKKIFGGGKKSSSSQKNWK